MLESFSFSTSRNVWMREAEFRFRNIDRVRPFLQRASFMSLRLLHAAELNLFQGPRVCAHLDRLAAVSCIRASELKNSNFLVCRADIRRLSFALDDNENRRIETRSIFVCSICVREKTPRARIR